MKKAGFIGLGIMGKPMAKNLLKAGVQLVVNDRNEAAVDELVADGAQKGTYEEIGENCEIVFTILPNGPIVQDVLFGEKGVENLTGLAAQLFLLQQDIAGKDEGDEEAGDSADYGPRRGDGGVQDIARAVFQEIHNTVEQTVPVKGQGIEPVNDLGVVGKELLRPVDEAGHGGLDGRAEAGDGIPQLWDDNQEEDQDHQNHQQQRQQQAQWTGQLFQSFAAVETMQGLGLQKMQGDIENKGHGTAHQERGDNAHQEADSRGDSVHILCAGKQKKDQYNQKDQFPHGRTIEFHGSLLASRCL